jgi:RimJ/RimL family protein N-acetyltransferase
MIALNHGFELPDVRPHVPSRSLLPAGDGLSAANQPLIRTGRLTLRRPEAGDAAAIAAGRGNYRVARMLTRVQQPYHVDDAVEWLESIADPDVKGWMFAITLGGVRAILSPGTEAANANLADRLIGLVSIEWRDADGREGWHIGFWLDESHWGKGIMTEAVNAVVARFLHDFMGETLYAAAMIDNPASLALQGKLGFDISGVAESYSVARGEMVRLITTELTFGSYMPL